VESPGGKLRRAFLRATFRHLPDCAGVDVEGEQRCVRAVIFFQDFFAAICALFGNAISCSVPVLLPVLFLFFSCSWRPFSVLSR
jgi:hypothetical protein